MATGWNALHLQRANLYLHRWLSLRCSSPLDDQLAKAFFSRVGQKFDASQEFFASAILRCATIILIIHAHASGRMPGRFVEGNFESMLLGLSEYANALPHRTVYQRFRERIHIGWRQAW